MNKSSEESQKHINSLIGLKRSVEAIEKEVSPQAASALADYVNQQILAEAKDHRAFPRGYEDPDQKHEIHSAQDLVI